MIQLILSKTPVFMFRKRWFRRGLITFVVCVVILLAFDQVDRYLTRRAGEKRYAEVVAHLDATDPRWRYDELDADRGQLPDDQNGALLVPKFKAAMAKPSFAMDKRLEAANFFEVPPNRVLDDDTYDAIDEILAANAEALAIARRFANYPRGLRRCALAPNPWDTRLPELEDMRAVCRLLDLAAERSGRDGRGGTALGSVRPMVHASRSLDGEPFLVVGLVRVTCLWIAGGRLERTLALSAPREPLAEIQELLLREADTDLFWSSVRGERAIVDQWFGRLRAGTLPFDTLVGQRAGSAAPEAQFAAWVYAPHLPADHATYLELVSRQYQVQALPEHQQREALAQIERDVRSLPATGPGSLTARVLGAVVPKVHNASLRTKARLRGATVGIAVERFRLAHGRWPNTLDQVPKDLLPVVPPDPFDGKPLKYTKRADGVTVYSVGQDGQDDGGSYRSDMQPNEPGQDVVFRLYDPARRGLPAEPKPGSGSFLTDEEMLDRFDGAPPEFGPEPREVGRQ